MESIVVCLYKKEKKDMSPLANGTCIVLNNYLFFDR